MNLTDEIVNKIFSDCCVSEEIRDEYFTDENNFHIVKLKFPLLDGSNIVVFKNSKLDEYRDIIEELLNNVSWLENELYIPLLGLMKTINGKRWTESVYDMEKLYALGVASNLISLKEIERGLVVTRVNDNQEIKVRKMIIKDID